MSSAKNVQSATRLDDVSVVVLSYNRKDELLNNLPALCKASGQTGFELIIVDNASTDGSQEFLAELAPIHPNLVLLLNESNIGVAEGRNIGWRAARGAYILQIDDDTRIDIDGIHALRTVLMRNENIGAVSPRILHAQTKKAQCDHGRSECDIGNYHGACHMVSRSAFQSVGAIDPMCIFGGEELDYSVRLRANGFSVLYIPDVTVFHNNFQRREEEGKFRRAMWLRNFIYVFFRHFPIVDATTYSFRYLLSHWISAYRTFGLLYSLSLPRSALAGALAGRRRYHPVPLNVRQFYANPATRPDFGNVPLVTKFRKRRSAGRIRR